MRRAFDVCANMLRQAMKPDRVSYNTLISACEKDEQMSRALDVCADMLHNAMHPNRVSYNGRAVAILAQGGKPLN